MAFCEHGELRKLCHKCPDLPPIEADGSGGGPVATPGAALTVSLPSGATVTFNPVTAAAYSHEGFLQYESRKNLPGSDYSDVRPFQQPISGVPGISGKAPVFRENVNKKLEQLNADPDLVPWVPVIYRDGALWLNGDKHHTFVATLLAKRRVRLRKAKLCQFTPDTVNWQNIVWVEGAARSTGIDKSQVT